MHVRCTAVGGYPTLAERWDGTSWAIQTTPTPTGGAQSSSLIGGVVHVGQRMHRRRVLS